MLISSRIIISAAICVSVGVAVGMAAERAIHKRVTEHMWVELSADYEKPDAPPTTDTSNQFRFYADIADRQGVDVHCSRHGFGAEGFFGFTLADVGSSLPSAKSYQAVELRYHDMPLWHRLAYVSKSPLANADRSWLRRQAWEGTEGYAALLQAYLCALDGSKADLTK